MEQISLDSIVAASTGGQISAELDNEAVILGMSKGRYYGLNNVGLFVWRLLQEPRSIGEITEEVVSTYDVDRERAESDILSLVDGLIEQGLVVKHGS